MTVSEAARLADHSAQWIRDQILAERLPAQERQAGSRKRLLVDWDDVQRLVADASPRPYRSQRADTARGEPPAGSPDGPLLADTPLPRPVPHPELSGSVGEFTLDSFLLEKVTDEKDKLSARVAELEGEVQALRANQVHLLATIRIALEFAKEPRS